MALCRYCTAHVLLSSFFLVLLVFIINNDYLVAGVFWKKVEEEIIGLRAREI